MIDVASLLGLVLGLGIVGAALVLGGVPAQALFQPEAILIVFGGTLTALCLHFSLADIHNSLYALSRVFFKDQAEPEEMVETVYDAAVYARTKGLLAVQPLLAQLEEPFLRKGLQMVVDNQPLEHIRTKLSTEMEVAFRSECHDARVYEAAAGFAPTMGIIGAIVGLIHVMGLLNTPQQLGMNVAGAFIATLYGVGFANIFLLPVAGKLKQRARDAWFVKSILLEGILAIRAGDHPSFIREKLSAYLYQPETEEDMDPMPVDDPEPMYAGPLA